MRPAPLHRRSLYAHPRLPDQPAGPDGLRPRPGPGPAAQPGLRRRPLAVCPQHLLRIPLHSGHPGGAPPDLRGHQPLHRRPGRSGQHPEVGGAGGPAQWLRQLSHVQRIRPAGHRPRRHGAGVQPPAPPGKHEGLRLPALSGPRGQPGGLGRLGHYHRKAALSARLRPGHDRSGQGPERPVVPHHPLYLRKDSLLEEFDAEGYLRTL